MSNSLYFYNREKLVCPYHSYFTTAWRPFPSFHTYTQERERDRERERRQEKGRVVRKSYESLPKEL